MLRILDKLQQQSNKPLSEEDLVDLHHKFMEVYGWIPLKEFTDMPLPTFWGLAYKVSEEKARRENFRLNMLMFAGVKNPK